MYIKSLEQMEEIVASKKYLHWDSWTVVQTFPTDKGRTSKYGLYRNGRWYIQKRFVPGSRGWDVPAKIVIVKNNNESK